ncbi:hypothetical protein COB64_03110 [Candidatus Wolfebacteria bacterium]|nr:MAG: hypothetical protein COB64_03110 [Candidatus Wolfebacteria bacterium]
MEQFEYWKKGIPEDDKESIKKLAHETIHKDSRIEEELETHKIIKGLRESNYIDFEEISQKTSDEISFLEEEEKVIRQKIEKDESNPDALKWEEEADSLRATREKLMENIQSDNPQLQ